MVANALHLGAGDDSLSLGLSPSNGHNSPQAPTNGATVSSELLKEIMNDDYNGDFRLSVPLLRHMQSQLHDLVEHIKQSGAQINEESPISSWLSNRGGRPERLSYMTDELDHVVTTFWSKFIPLVESILSDRPPNLTIDDLDFRCKKEEQIKQLKEYGTISSFYHMFVEIFFTELLDHCLVRKMAIIRLSNATPSPLVTQFVNIYLNLPVEGGSRLESGHISDRVAKELSTGVALNFNLEEASSRIGKLDQAVQLVFDPRIGLSMGRADNSGVKSVVDNFRQDCLTHSEQVSRIWGNLDGLSSFLSSPTNNLASFSETVKLTTPQLVYASICHKLLQLV